MTAWSLTGDYRFRVTWRGKVVMQVRETATYGVVGSERCGSIRTEQHYRWRDATLFDLQEINQQFQWRHH